MSKFNTFAQLKELMFAMEQDLGISELSEPDAAEHRLNLGTNPSVINPSPIMRISGTVSYPSQSKVAKGYIPELISLM